MTSPPVSQFSRSIFKSQIFLSNWRIWNAKITKNVDLLPSKRPTHIPLLLLPRHLHLPPHYLQIRHSTFRSHPPLLPLLRPRSRPLSPPMSSLADPNSADTKTVRVVVKGRVQGVFYRNWTVENAKELGLEGWVRNRRDGSVEAMFSGITEKVQEMEQRCRRGPPAAMVTGFEVFPCTDDPGSEFDRRPTA